MREAVLHKIFLDVNKVYDALDWVRCLEILTRYGGSPMVLCLLWMYWGQITMVHKAGGYYAPPSSSASV